MENRIQLKEEQLLAFEDLRKKILVESALQPIINFLNEEIEIYKNHSKPTNKISPIALEYFVGKLAGLETTLNYINSIMTFL